MAADTRNRCYAPAATLIIIGNESLPGCIQCDSDAHCNRVSTLSMTVGLSAASKGTHMSRFIELLEARTEALDQKGFKTLLLEMLERLEARSGSIEMRFPYFVRKAAPVSGVESLLDYEACWRGTVWDDGRFSFWVTVTVPATSLCPCSKEISDYGAHNQRSHIHIEAEITGEMAIEELIAVAERSASCEVYGLLKRTHVNRSWRRYSLPPDGRRSFH